PSRPSPTGKCWESTGGGPTWSMRWRGSFSLLCTEGSIGTTRAPGGRPVISACGIKYRVFPWKPTTSALAQWRPPGDSSILQAAPTARRRPVASSTRPVARVTRPPTFQDSMVLTRRSAASRRAFQRSPAVLSTCGRSGMARPSALNAKRAHHALPAGLQGGVDVAQRGYRNAAAAVDAHVGLQTPVRHSAVLLQELLDHLDVCRVEPQLQNALLGAVHLQHIADHIQNALGLGLHRMADHLARNAHGQIHQGLAGFLFQRAHGPG